MWSTAQHGQEKTLKGREKMRNSSHMKYLLRPRVKLTARGIAAVTDQCNTTWPPMLPNLNTL